MNFPLRFAMACAIAAAVSTFATPAAGAESPTTRPDAQMSVDELLRQAEASSDEAAVHATVEQIVKNYGRKAEEPLVRALRSRPLRGAGLETALTALVEIADPNDEHELKARMNNRWQWTPGGVMVCAVAIPNDAQSQKLLTRIAVGEFIPNPNKDFFGDDPTALYATGFLRCSADPEKVRREVQKPLWGEHTSQRGYLRALLSSLDYRASLGDAKKEKDYVDFERQLWWGYALAPKGTRGARLEYVAAAGPLWKHWKKEYEPFLRHTLQEPTSTSPEKCIATELDAALKKSPSGPDTRPPGFPRGPAPD